MSVMCKLFGHKLKTIKVNRYQMPTCEGCTRCGLMRSLEKANSFLDFEWHYNNGAISDKAGIFHIHDIKFGTVKCSNNT